MTRSAVREQLFKLLFQVEFNKEDEMDEQSRLFFECEDQAFIPDKNKVEISNKLALIMIKLEDIDKAIAEKTVGWSVERIGKVELTIMRIAIYEILYDEDVPASVAINEAVELAKKYGPDEASGFVNAVLAKFTK